MVDCALSWLALEVLMVELVLPSLWMHVAGGVSVVCVMVAF